VSASAFIAPPVSPNHAPGESEVEFSEAMLWAGDLVVESSPVRMSTVLGSCVSVCLFDPARRFGGMNHYLVPRGGSTAIHGEWSTTQLIERMRRLGSAVGTLQSKIFGGGCPLKLVNENYAIGAENVIVARRVLAAHGIPVVAERVGHGAGVRLFFENWTGVVWLRAHAEKK
jgi:chemotaxis protein CheD